LQTIGLCRRVAVELVVATAFSSFDVVIFSIFQHFLAWLRNLSVLEDEKFDLSNKSPLPSFVCFKCILEVTLAWSSSESEFNIAFVFGDS
jgi:hypothetical protein